MKRSGLLVAAIAALLLCNTLVAGEFEDAVRARWRGAWVILEVESYSSCSGSYSNNDVSGQFVSSKAGRKFEPGELAKVDKVQVKRKKAELMVSVPARTLLPRQDGPFTLYDERHCAIELEVNVSRELIKAKDVDAIDRLLAAVAERFAAEAEARDSSSWNGRGDDSYPRDYALTLARHAVWRAEQTNLTIDERLDAAMDQVEDLAEQVDDDPDYLNGFAAGTHEMREWNERACEKLLGGGFVKFRHRAPKERGEDGKWSEGYYDGQELVYSIAIMRRLPGCYVEVPSDPEDS